MGDSGGLERPRLVAPFLRFYAEEGTALMVELGPAGDLSAVAVLPQIGRAQYLRWPR